MCESISAVCVLWSLEATFYEASELLAVTFSECVNIHVSRNYHPVYMYLQVGHVVRAQFQCSKTALHTRIWASSRVVGGHYVVNQK